MAKLAKMNKKGTKMKMPHLKKTITDGFKDYVKAGHDDIDKDWENKDITDCKPCKGTGISPFEKMPCLGCDGSGKYFELVYGVKGKKPYAYGIQYGIDGMKEYCKAMREAEVANIRVEKATLKAFELMPYMRLDLMAEGVPVDEMMKSGDLRWLANKVSKEYPAFMCTNLKTF